MLHATPNSTDFIEVVIHGSTEKMEVENLQNATHPA